MGHSRHRKAAHRASRKQNKRQELNLFEHPKEGCDCRVEKMPILVECGRSILQKLHFDNRNKIVYFAIIYYKEDELGRGTELYSVDSGHGYFHEHTTGHRKRNDRRNIAPLYTQVDVQEYYDHGVDLVFAKHYAMSGR